MKPLLLTMQAFGPYAGRERLDFRPVLDEGLFGIYGPTGAGKSSIFNAMAVALFDRPLKSTDTDAQRSQFSDAGVQTQVEFIFGSGDKVYRVIRHFDFEQPKKKGKGTKVGGKKAALFDVTGLDIDKVGEGLPGVPIVEKLGDVTSEIKKILGYEFPQFKQLVLLPQGEFEEFLSSNSSDRLEILRKLFDVSLYENLANHFATREKKVVDDISTRRAVVEKQLETDGFASLEDLLKGIAAGEESVAELTKLVAAMDQAAQAAEGTFRQASEHKAVFKSYFDAKDAFAKVEAGATAINEKRALLSGAKKVQLVLPLVRQSSAEARTLKDAIKAVEDNQVLEKAAKNAHEEAQRLVQSVISEGAILPALEADLRALAAHEITLSKIAKLQVTATDAKGVLTGKSAVKAKVMADAETADGLVKAARSAIDNETAAQIRRAELRATLTTLRSEHRNAVAHAEAALELQKLVKALGDVQRKRDDAEKEFGDREAAHAQAEAALIANHAALLGAHLKPDCPCPVCGSSTHPSPAASDPGPADVVKAHERAKHALMDARASLDTSARKGDALAHQVESQRRTLDTITLPERAESAIGRDVAAAEGELKALGTELDLKNLRADLQTLESKLAAARAKAEQAITDVGEADTAHRLALQALEQASDTLPADLRTQVALDAARQALQSKISGINRRIANAQQAERDANNTMVKASADLVSARVSFEKATKRRSAAADAVTQALKEHELTADDLDLYASAVTTIAALEKDISSYDTDLAVSANKLNEATEAIKDLADPDVEPLREAAEAAKQQLLAVQDQRAEAAARLGHLKSVYARLDTEIAALVQLEADTAPVRDLAKHMAGRAGANMPLETFAIATMFDTVLEAANMRLRPMLRGRFALKREAASKGGGRKGLELSVVDAHTGGTRPVHTLSGGQTFITALALALGLSDVVESTRGNIRLDTLFIDEGFGSLDADDSGGTLDTVLTTLIEVVGGRRAVGVISHVPLVRQHIPAGFEIVAGVNGSRIQVLKSA